MRGRRIFPDKGDMFKPGDYGKKDGEWLCRCPDPEISLGSLPAHQVEEHPDGTITVSPSILIDQGPKGSWHGFLRHGIWSGS